MTVPRVSVVMPFRNAERHLAEAVESVIRQTFQDWELLLVDDGSEDTGPALVRGLAESDPRLRLLVSSPNRRGAAAARNLGIAAARGEFVAFLDSDDLYEPTKLGQDVAALDGDVGAAWVYSATRWFYDGGKRRDYVERLGVQLDRRYPPPEILCRIILEERGDIPCTCGVMIRKTALDAVGGFEERFALYEDQSLWVKLLLAFPVRVASGCRAAYRQHAASTSSAAIASGTYNQNGAHPARDAFLAWIKAYAVEYQAPAAVMTSLAIAVSANDGRFWTKLTRTLRVLSRYLV